MDLEHKSRLLYGRTDVNIQKEVTMNQLKGVCPIVFRFSDQKRHTLTIDETTSERPSILKDSHSNCDYDFNDAE